jgi:hypothetical protein
MHLSTSTCVELGPGDNHKRESLNMADRVLCKLDSIRKPLLRAAGWWIVATIALFGLVDVAQSHAQSPAENKGQGIAGRIPIRPVSRDRQGGAAANRRPQRPAKPLYRHTGATRLEDGTRKVPR